MSRSLDLCVFAIFAALLGGLWLLAIDGSRRPARRRRASQREPEESAPPLRRLCRPKEPWVRAEVIRLKALMAENGCRKIAEAFDSLYSGIESVGKTYVSNVLRDAAEEVMRVRREIKHARPKPLPKNRIWGLDLTYLPGRRTPILGIIDCGTRACLLLEELEKKSSLAILRAILAAARRFGLPATIRTDNEASLCSLLLRSVLRLLGVRHQHTAPHSPWQNGRIERLFGTFKGAILPRLAELRALGCDPLRIARELATFRLWYNHVRSHHHLGGLTPAEAWDGLRSTSDRKRPRRTLFSTWEGRLTGFF